MKRNRKKVCHGDDSSSKTVALKLKYKICNICKFNFSDLFQGLFNSCLIDNQLLNVSRTWILTTKSWTTPRTSSRRHSSSRRENLKNLVFHGCFIPVQNLGFICAFLILPLILFSLKESFFLDCLLGCLLPLNNLVVFFSDYLSVLFMDFTTSWCQTCS